MKIKLRLIQVASILAFLLSFILSDTISPLWVFRIVCILVLSFCIYKECMETNLKEKEKEITEKVTENVQLELYKYYKYYNRYLKDKLFVYSMEYISSANNSKYAFSTAALSEEDAINILHEDIRNHFGDSVHGEVVSIIKGELFSTLNKEPNFILSKYLM